MTAKSIKTQCVIAGTMLLAGFGAAICAHADAVTDWNANADQAIQTAAQPPPVQGRLMAIVHTAIYDAVNGIEQKYTPYMVTDSGPRQASAEAAAAQAGYTTLLALFPAQK